MSCGRPVLNVDVAIFDDDGRRVPVNTVGEIWIRGPTLMKGYWGKPDKTEEVLVKDDKGLLWFRSGDIGRMCSEGYVYILDRCVLLDVLVSVPHASLDVCWPLCSAKDLVNRGGEKISCAEVESALFEHPAVVESAVFAVPESRLGEEVCG
jgi:long-chain acyl-CoA synthetase